VRDRARAPDVVTGDLDDAKALEEVDHAAA
jgi:hypothetical protein